MELDKRSWKLTAFILLLIKPGWCLAATGLDNRLIEAVKADQVQEVKAQLARHSPVNVADADGSTPLQWAAQRNNLVIAKLLLKAGADVARSTRFKITPLYFACRNGNAEMVELLLNAGADPNSTFEEGQTALMTAALTGDTNVIKLLIQRGAKVNATEPVQNQTALMWAAAEGNFAAVGELIEFEADVKAKTKHGFTPFLFAVRNGHTAACKILLEHGADVNDIAADGTSALNMAVLNAYYGLAMYLLDRGADPNAADPRGSALHILAWFRKPGSDSGAGTGTKSYSNPLPSGDVTALELAKALLKHGANPNARIAWTEKRFDKEGGTVRNPPLIQLGRHYLSYQGATPFYIAAQGGDSQMMRLLAENSADPKLPTQQGITPLMAASGLGYWEGESPGPFTGCSEAERLEAVKLALELGNDINAHADFGDYKMVGDPAYTLLYYPLNIDELIDKVPGDPRWSGSTALFGAILSGQAGIVQYLVDHGADVNATTKLGWTPLMVAEGVFYANAKKEYPAAAAIIRKALKERGLNTSEKARAVANKPGH